MSTNTPNEGLIKPDTTDNADLTIFVGQNMDKLDTALNVRVKKDTYGTTTNPTNSAFRVGTSGGQQMAGGAVNKIVFDTPQFDIQSEYDASLYRFVAKTSGIYQFNACVRFGSTLNTQAFLTFYKNGVENTRVQNFVNGGTGNAVVQVHGTSVMQLAVNDYVEVYSYSSVATSTQGTGSGLAFDATFFAGVKIC